MLKVVCPHCKAENTFQTRSSLPSECSFCWEPIPEGVQIVTEEDNKEITGLTIIYQITQQRIEISTLHKVILGRENCGANVFSQILFNGKPVVSRKHCSIEYKGKNFYLIDEGSLNGTFYGVNKLSCKDTPHVIEDKSIIYIGEEAFIAQINYREMTPKEGVYPVDERTKTIMCYRCNDENCSGFESPVPFDICPVCGAWKKSTQIYV